jgi:sulfur-oxidizing protein SoxB
MTYALAPGAKVGARISDMRLKGKPLEAAKRYRVAGWAPVAEGASGEPIWEVVSRHLRAKKTLPPKRTNQPRLIAVKNRPGVS